MSRVLASLSGLRALVTGGGSGLGNATAKRLVDQGVKVIVCDLAGAENVHKDVVFSKTDVTSEEEVSSAMDLAVKKFGGLDCVVHCAGRGIAQRTYSTTSDRPHSLAHFEEVLRVNTLGTFNVCRLAAQVMAKNKPTEEDNQRGVIVTTASVAAYEGQIGQVAYSASKGAITSMTLPMARDLSSLGIRVVSIAPGLLDTPLLASLPEKVRKQLATTVPFPRRLGHPDEFAFLVESVIRNPMLNGCTIRLDGALRMQP